MSDAIMIVIDFVIMICLMGYWFYTVHRRLSDMDETLDRIEGHVDNLVKR